MYFKNEYCNHKIHFKPHIHMLPCQHSKYWTAAGVIPSLNDPTTNSSLSGNWRVIHYVNVKPLLSHSHRDWWPESEGSPVTPLKRCKMQESSMSPPPPGIKTAGGVMTIPTKHNTTVPMYLDVWIANLMHWSGCMSECVCWKSLSFLVLFHTMLLITFNIEIDTDVILKVSHRRLTRLQVSRTALWSPITRESFVEGGDQAYNQWGWDVQG